MIQKLKSHSLDRRQVMAGASAAALVAIAPLSRASAQEVVQEPTMEDALKAAIGDAKPIEGKVKISMHEVAENGNTVPYTVSVDSEGATNQVKALHVFATKNPNPNVASFYFSPRSGQAKASSRMRLGTTQEVMAVAEMKDGSVYMNKQIVKVTIGGCGG